ncbi:MAG: LysR substrate-binding domain-containing protein, partial [Pseudomonadota bacterium]
RHDNREVWRFKSNKNQINSQSIARHFSANTAEMQLQACLSGIGIGLLPIFAAHPYLESGELIELFPEYSTYPPRGIYTLFPQNRYMSSRTRLFIDWLHDCSLSYPWRN